MMPEMTGMDLHDQLLRDAPHLAKRIIFLTGGAFTARARTFLETVPNLRIEKPFDADALREAIAVVMRAQRDNNARNEDGRTNQRP
jgi:FixJ family two-component response regulator